MNFFKIIFFLGLPAMFVFSCKKDEPKPPVDPDHPDLVYDPTPYQLAAPAYFPLLEMPADNPMTEEGILLGRMLFYDPILSGDSTLSCAGCHKQEYAFSDENQFSTGIDGLMGDRQAMPVMNIAWVSDLFWDGRAEGVEAQALGPVENPIEMHETWPNAMEKLKRHPEYPSLFFYAFGTWDITKEHAAKAIAQFERTLISADTRFDKKFYLLDPNPFLLTDEEIEGHFIFNTEKGDCFHCHGGSLLTDNLFHNNGLDANSADEGLGKVTGKTTDRGKFKTPSLRNIALTGPYMHDGRFATLEEVVDFYSDSLQFSETIDPLMKNVHQGGIRLTAQEKSNLIAFLHTFTDTAFVHRKEFSNPF
ncbi:MAG: cytochrome C peroxidase [Saprospiraceae bacterium]|nr:cytochrome C peroxidase [Saprospiraceae bacterium]MCF8248984.1 cytochrome C peroxidase [Saprospiraceae bacterium]MCF8279195.1 hypothetical protein [Bacteroidales bacterium]MCF8310878.1 cytochrome C peroxidase [Saprospiraceae bacterium]MCF8439534.1 cytochrome C peroxidase [Saprospiraceae bacterium]